MIITFTPTDSERRVYEFDPNKLMSVEAELVEKKVGKPYGQAVTDIMQGSALARRALVFVLEKRTHPTLNWDAFDFPFDAVEFEFDRDELTDMRARVEASPLISDEDRTQALAQLDQLIAEAPEPAPKAPAPSAEPAT